MDVGGGGACRPLLRFNSTRDKRVRKALLLCRQITGFKWAALPEGTSVDCSLGSHDTGNLPWMIPRNISWHCEGITLQSAYIDYWLNELLNEWAIHCFFSIISYFWISCNHSITFEISVHTYGQTGGNLLIQAVLTQVRITYYPQIFLSVSDETF